MGHLIFLDKPLFEAGDDCVFCQDPSRWLWDAGGTPKELKVVFRDIFTCPWGGPRPEPPNNRLFCLTQRVGMPCHWRFEDDDWLVNYDTGFAGDPRSHLILTTLGPALTVFDSYYSAGPCVLDQVNYEQVCVPWQAYAGGYAKVWFHADNRPQQLINQYHFCPINRTLFERHGEDEVLESIHIFHSNGGTNCQILIDKDNFP